MLSFNDWPAALGVFNGPISDRQRNLKSEAVRLVTIGFKMPHHFALPYRSWSSEAVESLGKELIQTLLVVLSELQCLPEQ